MEKIENAIIRYFTILLLIIFLIIWPIIEIIFRFRVPGVLGFVFQNIDSNIVLYSCSFYFVILIALILILTFHLPDVIFLFKSRTLIRDFLLTNPSLKIEKVSIINYGSIPTIFFILMENQEIKRFAFQLSQKRRFPPQSKHSIGFIRICIPYPHKIKFFLWNSNRFFEPEILKENDDLSTIELNSNIDYVASLFSTNNPFSSLTFSSYAIIDINISKIEPKKIIVEIIKVLKLIDRLIKLDQKFGRLVKDKDKTWADLIICDFCGNIHSFNPNASKDMISIIKKTKSMKCLNCKKSINYYMIPLFEIK